MRRFALLLALAACAPAASEDEVSGGEDALGADTYETYADFARDAGLPPEEGHATVIGLRGVTFEGTAHATSVSSNAWT